MKDFRLFDVYDFLMDEDFIRWVRAGKKEDHDFWNNWLGQNPDKHIIVLEAKTILQSFSEEPQLVTKEEKNGEVVRLLSTIKEKESQPLEAGPAGTVRNIKRWWIAAATLMICLTGVLFLIMIRGTKKQAAYTYKNIIPSARLLERVNNSAIPVSIKMPDGSVIELSPESRISYANNFDSADTRDVYLSGEAFFTVTKNPGRPFRVFANEIVTKVLGTSFRIRSFEKDSAINVVVRTGKVSVYSQATADNKETSAPHNLGGIILTPNQELVYQKAQQKFQKVLNDNPVMVLPAEQDKTLLYEEASLIKVFNQLSSNYGINIVYDNEALKACTITADLRNVPFYEKLALMCKAIGARYEVIDGQVVIQANGCG